jgi:hypothetical protein
VYVDSGWLPGGKEEGKCREGLSYILCKCSLTLKNIDNQLVMLSKF